jgi:hypothetical protein
MIEQQPLVRLMPDYSAPMPLWGRWQQLDLPELLLRRLAAWQKDFDFQFPLGPWVEIECSARGLGGRSCEVGAVAPASRR